MNEESFIAPAPPVPARIIKTRSQQRATAVADGLALRQRWKDAIPAAQTRWPRIAIEDLKKVAGNHHRLAGLLQLRNQLSREASDVEVKAFFDTHLAETPAHLRPR